MSCELQFCNYSANLRALVMGSVIVVLALFYFLPSVIALLKWRHNSVAIIALNILLGWTLIGWVVSLVWALTSADKAEVNTTINNINSQEPGAPVVSTNQPKAKSDVRVFNADERVLSNDAFKLFLIDTYKIKKNDLLDKFVCHEKIYDSLDDCLNACKDTYERKVQAWEAKLQEDAVKLSARQAEEAAEREREIKSDRVMMNSVLGIIAFVLIVGCIYGYQSHKQHEIEARAARAQLDIDAKSIGFADAAEMERTGFASLEEFHRAQEIKPSYFIQNCQFHGEDNYNRLCFGRKVIWEGQIVSISTQSIRINLLENHRDTYKGEKLSTVDSKSLWNRGITEDKVGYIIDFVGTIDKENTIYPDVENVTWFQLHAPVRQAPAPTPTLAPNPKLPTAQSLAPTMPADIATLANKEMALDANCRGTFDQNTQKTCEAREAVTKQIEAKGWCWGHKDDDNASRTWVTCGTGDIPVQNHTLKFGTNCISNLQGCAISAVVPGGVADKSSLQIGDVLVEFKGNRVRAAEDVVSVLKTVTAGEEVKYVVLRNGQQVALFAKF
jgi:hypothetical protein